MQGDVQLKMQGEQAVSLLARLRQRGAYRVIRDPEGVISLWAIEGLEKNAFSLSFANRGRISGSLTDMPAEFVRAFVAYVNMSCKG